MTAPGPRTHVALRRPSPADGADRAVRRVDPRRWPWWAQALAVYALARAVSAAVLLGVARHQVATSWVPASPSYLEFTGLMWDAGWYQQVATSGYPEALPTGPDGRVLQNAWAFFPLFPLLVRGVMTLTGAPWLVAAPLLALAIGAVAAVLVHAAVRLGAPRAVAVHPGLPLATVAVATSAPASPVLGAGYTESLALALVAGTLVLLLRQRYGWAVLTVVALGFTRAVALPMAVVVVVHAVVRWRAAARTGTRLRVRDLAGPAVLAGVAVVVGFAWPAITAAATGVPDAYLRTQGAWRGRPEVVPLLPWVDVARVVADGAWPFLLGGTAAVAVAIMLSPSARRLGPELWAWTAAYGAYLVGVIEPGTSLVRFGLLAFPVAAVVVGWVRHPARARRLWLAVVLVVAVLGQVAWTWGLWRLTPPSGWPP